MQIRPLPFAPQYAISDAGQVFGLRGQLIAGGFDGFYQRIQLRIDGSRKMFLVHRLVAETFIGPVQGVQVRHLDGNSQNNSWRNLARGTQLENEADKLRHGRRRFGLECYNGRYSNAQVRKIRGAAKGTIKQLAKKLGMPISYAYELRTGRYRKLALHVSTT